MKYGFYSGCREMILAGDYKRLADYMLENGYSHYEPLENIHERPLFESLGEAERFGRYMKERGLRCACLSVFANIHPDTEHAREELRRSVDVAAALGSPFIHHTSYTHLALREGMPTYNELLSSVSAVIVDTIRYAAGRGVTAIYEPQGMFFNGVDGFFGLFNSLKSEDGCENIGICFDFGNSIFADCMPLDFLRAALPYVKHAHLKDYKFVSLPQVSGRYYTRGGRMIEDVVVGEGDMQVRECLSMLLGAGYNGIFSTESVPSASGMDAYMGGAAAISAAEKMM